MPNTKSAARRMRNSERRRIRNQSVTSRLHTLEKKFSAFVLAKKKDEAAEAWRLVVSAFDKAAKKGVIHKRKADRKKSRLALRLNTVS